MPKKKSVGMIEIPEGVAAVGVSADGKRHYIQEPFLRGMRWKEISVDSASFKKLPPAERLYRLSRDYLSAAIVLCEQAGEAGERLEWPQASVCYYCLHLATELFLRHVYKVLAKSQVSTMRLPSSGGCIKFYCRVPSTIFKQAGRYPRKS